MKAKANKDVIFYFPSAVTPQEAGLQHAQWLLWRTDVINECPCTSLFQLAFLCDLMSYGMEYLAQLCPLSRSCHPSAYCWRGTCWKSAALVLGSAVAKTLVCYQHPATPLQNTAKRCSGENYLHLSQTQYSHQYGRNLARVALKPSVEPPAPTPGATAFFCFFVRGEQLLPPTSLFQWGRSNGRSHNMLWSGPGCALGPPLFCTICL